MIQIGHYYRSETPQGIRTIKCMQMDSDGNPYGIYSPSDYTYSGDDQGIIIKPEDSPEATELQAQAWEAWYNSNV
jgi:hypothetical protein